MTRVDQISVVGIGPQKTATTWLARALEPSDICLPAQVKETFFWDRKFAKGEGWYFCHFQGAGPKAEIGPSYFHSVKATARLKAHNPQLRIIVTLRDPADRAYSLYLHHFRKGRTRKSFREAMVAFPEILEASQYKNHLSRWIKAFGPAQVLVVLQDDIERAPHDVLTQVSEFIGCKIKTERLDIWQRVNAGGRPRFYIVAALATKIADALRALGLYRVINFAKALGLKKRIYGRSGQALPPLTLADRRWLASMFADDIGYVEELLSVSLESWRAVDRRAD